MSDGDFYRFDHWYSKRRGVPCTCPSCTQARREKYIDGAKDKDSKKTQSARADKG